MPEPTEPSPSCFKCHRTAAAVELRPWGDGHVCLECVTPISNLTGQTPGVLMDWLTAPGDPEREAEVARETDEKTRAIAVEGQADGVRVTVDGYGHLGDLEIAPELLRRDDFTEALLPRLNEAREQAMLTACYKGQIVQGVAFPPSEFSITTQDILEEGIWDGFPYDYVDRELMAGLWYHWRQHPISIDDLAAAAGLDLQLLEDVITGTYPSTPELFDHDVEWARRLVTRAVGRVFGVSSQDIIDSGVEVCWHLDVANLAILLGETDSTARIRSSLRDVHYGPATVQALQLCRERYGGAGPLETVSRALEAGALGIDAPPPAVYPRRPLRSRWNIAYVDYSHPWTVVYTELVLDVLGLSLDELAEGVREVLSDDDGMPRLDLVAFVHSRDPEHGAYTREDKDRLSWAMERLEKDHHAEAAPHDLDEEAMKRCVSRRHLATCDRILEILTPDYRDAYAQQFLAEGPAIELTSRRGRSWEEVDAGVREQLSKDLRLRTPLFG